MRLTILALGSQGDVQPYIALGAALKDAGYDVRLATHINFEGLVRSHGLEFFLLEGNPREMIETEAGQALMETGPNIITHVRQLKSMANALIEQVLTGSLKACQGTDAIIHSAFGFGGFYIAKKLKVPSIAAFIMPFTRTRAFPSITMPQLRLGGLYNWLSHIFFEQLFWQMFKPGVEKWLRESLGLPPPSFMGDFGTMHKRGYTIVYGYSPAVVPKPPDCGERIHVTGYWFLERQGDWQPPPDLVAFLQAGPPPIYVGFGSMSNRNPEAVTDIVLKALKRCKQRGILLTGWGGLFKADLPEYVYPIESIPFDWLFPKMSAVVHHGGAGTIASGIRAGVPTIVVPFFADQPFWGERVYRLGAGPKPIPRRQLTSERLAKAIDTVLADPGMRKRANKIGERIGAEDGLAAAVEVISGYLKAG
jgi:UDP:flavonoid glycosyltransferase YjiC (YdhE family)